MREAPPLALSMGKKVLFANREVMTWYVYGTHAASDDRQEHC
jgi:hypothetical protein